MADSKIGSVSALDTDQSFKAKSEPERDLTGLSLVPAAPQGWWASVPVTESKIDGPKFAVSVKVKTGGWMPKGPATAAESKDTKAPTPTAKDTSATPKDYVLFSPEIWRRDLAKASPEKQKEVLAAKKEQYTALKSYVATRAPALQKAFDAKPPEEQAQILADFVMGKFGQIDAAAAVVMMRELNEAKRDKGEIADLLRQRIEACGTADANECKLKPEVQELDSKIETARARVQKHVKTATDKLDTVKIKRSVAVEGLSAGRVAMLAFAEKVLDPGFKGRSLLEVITAASQLYEQIEIAQQIVEQQTRSLIKNTLDNIAATNARMTQDQRQYNTELAERVRTQKVEENRAAADRFDTV